MPLIRDDTVSIKELFGKIGLTPGVGESTNVGHLLPYYAEDGEISKFLWWSWPKKSRILNLINNRNVYLHEYYWTEWLTKINNAVQEYESQSGRTMRIIKTDSFRSIKI